MNITERIRKQIVGFEENTTFGYEQLDIKQSEYQTVAKALERLQKDGLIKKISKGVFYKPKKTVFGELKPNEEQILRPYLYRNGKRIAYITGTYLYNQLGLTMQTPYRIKIASMSKRIYVNTGAIEATPVKSYVEVTEDNYRLLGLLDAIKDLKKIPDSNIESSISILSDRIKQLDENRIEEMIRYALRYPPRVRAFLGAILERLGFERNLEKLRNSLNPLTKYKMGLATDVLTTASNWNIV